MRVGLDVIILGLIALLAIGRIWYERYLSNKAMRQRRAKFYRGQL